MVRTQTERKQSAAFRECCGGLCATTALPTLRLRAKSPRRTPRRRSRDAGPPVRITTLSLSHRKSLPRCEDRHDGKGRSPRIVSREIFVACAHAAPRCDSSGWCSPTEHKVLSIQLAPRHLKL